MVTKGYTTADNVASQLGRTLTDDQTAYLNAAILPAVEAWIDLTGGRSYGEQSVVAEPLYMSGAITWLNKVPVDSVSAVRGYYWNQTAADMAVLNASWWLLQDARIGQLYLPGWQNYQHLEVDYTPDAAIPNNIKLAAAIVAGIFMRTNLHPQTEWLTEFASGQDVRVKFRNQDVPQHVYDLIGGSAGGATIVVA